MGSMSKRTGKRMPSRDLDAALVDATERILVREGPAAVTVRAVAAEAGVAPMGVYNRFGSKDGLMEAVVVRGFEGLRRATAPRGEPDLLDRLRSSGRRYREFALANRAHYAVMFGAEQSADDLSPELKAAGHGAFQELVAMVSTGMAAGQLIPGDEVDVARQIWSALHGAVTLELLGRIRGPSPEVTYEGLLELLVRGLSVR
jgi:AcrR family transcriptional regulator